MQTLLEPVLLPSGMQPSHPSTVQQACVQLWVVGSAEEDAEFRCYEEEPSWPGPALQHPFYALLAASGLGAPGLCVRVCVTDV